MTTGPGHIVVYGNAAFRTTFGDGAVGLPARESMLGFPAASFELLDAVLRHGRPLARWIRRDDQDWRLTAMPRVEFGTDAVYGVSFHLRARDDVPIIDPD
jgi:hypothetical protein